MNDVEENEAVEDSVEDVEKDEINFTQVMSEAAGISPKRGETESSFAKRLVRAFTADNFSDDKWEEMGEAAQEVANTLLKAHEDEKPLPNLPGWNEFVKSSPVESKSSDGDKKVKKERVAKEKSDRGPSVVLRIKELLCEYPKSSKDDIQKLLQGEGLEAADATVLTVRTHFIAALKVLKNKGHLTGINF